MKATFVLGTICKISFLSLAPLLPSARFALAPVGRRVAGRLQFGPLRARACPRLLVGAVEQDDDALVSLGLALKDRRRPRARQQHAQPGAIGIVVAGGEENRLRLRFAVACRTMGKEAFVRIGPQPLVERLDPFAGRRLDHSPQALSERLLEQRRQRLLRLAALQVIEADFGHQRGGLARDIRAIAFLQFENVAGPRRQKAALPSGGDAEKAAPFAGASAGLDILPRRWLLAHHILLV